MKKLTALILTLSMLLSMCVLPMGATAAEITEAERQELLSAPYYQYVDLSSSANADLFASFEEAGTYARFNKSASGTSSDKDATYTFTEEVEGESKEVTIYDWLPISTDIAYSDVTFYKKGFKPTDTAPADGTYMIEDLLLENGSKVTTTQYTGGNNSSPLTAYNGTYTHTKVVTRTVNNSHVMDVVTENDATYAVIKNSGIQHKIGPLSRDAYSPNAVYLSTSEKDVPVNMSGNKLSVLFMLGNLHANYYTASYTGVGAAPLISIQKVSLYYEGDSTAHDKYVFVEHNTEANYNANYLTKKPFVSRAVVYAPKNEDGTALTKDDFYNSDASLRKTFKYVTADNAAEHGIDVTTFNPNEGIQFPNDKYIVAERATVAAIFKQRQGILENDYSNSANLINIPLENKVLEKVSYKTDYTLKNYEGAWWIGTSDTARQGIIPIEIPSANQDYEYFIYTGSVANTSSVVGMTVVGESLQDKIDALNTVLSALDSAALTEEDVASYRAQIAELKAASQYILDSDFDTSKLDAAEERIEEEKAAERAKEIVNAPNMTNFPISEATGANSTLFMLYDTSADSDYTNSASLKYNPGIDYTSTLNCDATDYFCYPTGDFTADAENLQSKPYAFVYSIDDADLWNRTAEFTTKNGQVVWTINGVDYNVNPEEKVFQLSGSIKTTKMTDTTNKDLYDRAAKATFDIPDGYYDKIGFLVTSGYDRTFSATFYYEDGSKSSKIDYTYAAFKSGTDTASKAAGNVYLKLLSDTSENVTRAFRACEFDVEEAQKITKVELTASTWHGQNPVCIISAWGSNKNIAEKLAELEAIDITDEATYEAAKAAIADFDAYLADLGYTVADLASYKAPYTNLQTAIADYEEELKADRLAQAVYAPIEMDFLNDYFATRAERGGSNDTFWYDGTQPYKAYLGYISNNDKLPHTRAAYSNGGVISIDASADTAINKIATLTNGRYVLPVGNVPYRLGEMTENALDGNAFEIGTMILKSDDNLLNSKVDDRYTTTLTTPTDGSTPYYTVQAGKFPVNVPNANKVNVLTTALRSGSTSGAFELYTVNALVHLDDGSYVGYILLTSPGCSSGAGRNVKQSVLFVPKNSETDFSTYAAIKSAVGGEVKTLEDMTQYDYSDVKLPSAPTVKGASVSKYSNIGLTTTRATERNFYYDNVIMPEDTKMIYRDHGYRVDGYVSSFEITAPEGRTITAVEFIHDAAGTLAKTGEGGYVDNVDGVLASAEGSTAATLLVPATLAGVEDYDVYVAITRNCHFSAVLGMTAEATGTEVVANLNTLMANATESDIEAIESMKAFIDGETVLYTDLDAAARANYEAVAEAANVAGTIALSNGENGAKTVTANIKNITGLAGKKYTLIIAFYDANGNLIKAVPQQYTTGALKEFSQTLTVENVPENTASVKGFIWKDFKTLIPLGTEAK